MNRLAHALNWQPERGKVLLAESRKQWTVSEKYPQRRGSEGAPEEIAYRRVYARFSGLMRKHGIFPNIPFSELLGCSSQQLVLHLQSQFRHFMHWDNAGDWHIDHIRPCSSYDLSRPEQQRACFHYSNLQPLWRKDNFKKGAKYASSFRR